MPCYTTFYVWSWFVILCNKFNVPRRLGYFAKSEMLRFSFLQWTRNLPTPTFPPGSLYSTTFATLITALGASPLPSLRNKLPSVVLMPSKVRHLYTYPRRPAESRHLAGWSLFAARCSRPGSWIVPRAALRTIASNWSIFVSSFVGGPRPS